MTAMPRVVLVSGDAELMHIDEDKTRIDPQSKRATMSGFVRLRKEKQGQLSGLLRNPNPAVLSLLEWTTRSFKARVGLDVTQMHLADAIRDKKTDDLLVDADFVVHAGLDRDGNPDRSPLVDMLPRMLRDRKKLEIARLFYRAGIEPFDEGRIRQEQKEQRLMLHPDAKFVEDGVILPSDDEQFPLRFDLMNRSILEQGLAGLGRGAIRKLQPPVIDRQAVMPPQGYMIGSTKFSLGKGRCGVLDRQVYDLRTMRPFKDRYHGRSKYWDGGRTAGIEHTRHTEWESESWDETSLFDAEGSPLLGTKVQIYPAGQEKGSVVSVSVPAVEYHRSGFTTDHWVRGNGQQPASGRIRSALSALERGLHWGVLVGPEGMRPVFREKHRAHQSLEIHKQVALYGTEGGTNYPHYPVAELGTFLRQVGNHEQRVALFCEEAPSPEELHMLIAQGVRTVFTSRMSKGEQDSTCVSNNQLQHYKTLARVNGLQLYVATPTRIRKLWNDLFVDVRKLEQIKKVDVRIGCYGASATNAEALLEHGKYGEALQDWLRRYPHSALVSGAAVNGAMGYMNRVAESLGFLTVGIANRMRGQQETPDEKLDAIVTFAEDDFEARQALMAQITTHPLVGPGSQGSAYEALLEFVLRKMAKTCMTPVPLIDPVGLGVNGEHLWEPLQRLQQSFNQEYRVDDRRSVVLSRSPYVESMGYLVETYPEAMDLHDAFMRAPQEQWARWGIPEASLHTSIERTLRDSESTGFPFPSFLQQTAKRYNIL